LYEYTSASEFQHLYWGDGRIPKDDLFVIVKEFCWDNRNWAVVMYNGALAIVNADTQNGKHSRPVMELAK